MPVVPLRAMGDTLVPPSDPQQLGWWRDGAFPGARHGSVVVTGHTVHTGGGAFDHLDSLEAGDRIRILTRQGAVNYVVTVVRSYTKSELVERAAALFDPNGPARLVLVTCSRWNGASYDGNTVALALPARGWA